MPTLTLPIPDDLHRALEARAAEHERSVAEEAVERLKSDLLPQPDRLLAQADAIRERLAARGVAAFTEEEFERAVDEGRP